MSEEYDEKEGEKTEEGGGEVITSILFEFAF